MGRRRQHQGNLTACSAQSGSFDPVFVTNLLFLPIETVRTLFENSGCAAGSERSLSFREPRGEFVRRGAMTWLHRFTEQQIGLFVRVLESVVELFAAVAISNVSPPLIAHRVVSGIVRANGGAFSMRLRRLNLRHQA